VLDVVCLLAETQPPEQCCGWSIQNVSRGGNAASRKGGKQVVKQTLQCLGGVALSLPVRCKGDPHLKLLWLVSQTVQPAVANQQACPGFDDGHLKPRARNSNVPILLVVEKSSSVIGSEGLP